jgi:hypothetical protein
MQTADRTLLEPIREMPGLLMMFIIAGLSFLTLGRMGAVAMVTRAAACWPWPFLWTGSTRCSSP